MDKIVLELDYESRVLYDLEKTWVQRQISEAGYMLCYKDKEWDRRIIYRSRDKQLLFKLQDKMMREVSEGKKYIKL